MPSTKKLLVRLRQAGLEANVTRGGHIRIETPSGPVFSAASGSDRRGTRNLCTVLRMRGIKIDWRQLS
jgi:hypothetical protein